VHPVDLVVVGPDNFLADGLTDAVRALGIPVFGPSKAAAEIEWSKSYAKQLMLEEGIPTAASRTFSDPILAQVYARTQRLPIVLKADGLALGKGVVIAGTYEEADAAITALMRKASGKQLIIEEYLTGLEVSVHAICDGEEAILFPISKDHKRIGEGDTGPNTGGMGTVAPVPGVSPEQIERIQDLVVLPTLQALKKRGRPFSGLLFPGIMLTEKGPYVIEFNARFGDPETQSYMRLLTSDLFDALYACATGKLGTTSLTWSEESACCIMLASGGYPQSSGISVPIHSVPQETDAICIFHSGTKKDNDILMTHGGRVLGVTAVGTTLTDALEKAYAAGDHIQFEGKQFRRDIGASLT
jgi:phosphoribosylamine--glycine ligase